MMVTGSRNMSSFDAYQPLQKTIAVSLHIVQGESSGGSVRNVVCPSKHSMFKHEEKENNEQR